MLEIENLTLFLFLLRNQSYFEVSKYVRLNFTHFTTMEISNIRQLQQIALNHSPDIDFKDFTGVYQKFTAESYSVFSS